MRVPLTPAKANFIEHAGTAADDSSSLLVLFGQDSGRREGQTLS
jgi:hypothetical protein